MNAKRYVIYPILGVLTFGLASRGFRFFWEDSLVLPFMITLMFFTIIFVIAQIVKDNSIVDMFWGSGFVIGSLSTLFITPSPTPLSLILVAFIVLWGVRLSWRLIKRNWGKPEDFRYAQWRQEWGDKVVITAFFRVFMIQGIINFIVGSASYTVIRFNTFTFEGWPTVFVISGLLIAFTGLFFEVVGDEQLRRHIQSGKKQLMKSGLWKLTRHPNYFGEILIWAGLYVTGFALIGSQIHIIFYGSLIVSPLIMSAVLIKISTPLLEKHMAKYEGWEAYTKQTPMIFPWGKKA